MIGASGAGRRKVTRLIRRWLLGTALLLALAATIAVFAGSRPAAAAGREPAKTAIVAARASSRAVTSSQERISPVTFRRPAQLAPITVFPSLAPPMPKSPLSLPISCYYMFRRFARLTLGDALKVSPRPFSQNRPYQAERARPQPKLSIHVSLARTARP